ncbi:MAG: Glu-tRNA(Gln) amidotransferase subunit GatE [Halobacteriota archaeon]
MKEHEYQKIGLKAGLEIHQQLNTKTKLFCSSTTELRDTKDALYDFYRYLRPSKSEMGEIDRAALEEGAGTRRFTYKAYSNTCLVENDDEPPMELNLEALKIALQIALLLRMQPFDEIHTMRKLVIDGSTTSGFQRTALLASDGSVSLGNATVRVETLSIEEEAAQIVAKDVYSLDRLGIPLVEIGTAPDITTPKMAKELALTIGTILRACNVKRGIGTIRQDINISIAGGARVEIKGVQALELIEEIVRLEVMRQMNLLKVKDELAHRQTDAERPVEVTSLFTRTNSKILQKQHVWSVLLHGFAGLLGREIQPGRRLGSELADRAKKRGVAGIFHTDELPHYGITQREVDELLAFLGAGQHDAAVIVAHDHAKTCLEALYAVIERAREATTGVPEETRRALQNGCSEYMRPLPGAARMYPETDVSPIVLAKPLISELEQHLPEQLSDKARRYKNDYLLNDELARRIAWSENSQLFEDIMALRLSFGDSISQDEGKDFATLAATTVEGTFSELRRDHVPVERLMREHVLDAFRLVITKSISKEGIPDVLRTLAQCPTKTASEAAEELGFVMLSADELERIIDDVVHSRLDFVKAKGSGAVGPLMGLVMKQTRGKADGRLVNEMLQARILSLLEQR